MVLLNEGARPDPEFRLLRDPVGHSRSHWEHPLDRANSSPEARTRKEVLETTLCTECPECGVEIRREVI